MPDQRLQCDKLFSPLQARLQEVIPRYESGESFRVFHGRGGAYPTLNGCNIDFYRPVWVMTFYDEVFEPFETSLIKLLGEHIDLLGEMFNSEAAIMVQRRYLSGAPWECVKGTLPQQVYAKRAGSQFYLRFNQQNIGFFLDIEPARTWLDAHANDARVLNLFSYTCTFSVVAQKAGARSIVNMDLSTRSLAIGRENHRVNHLATEPVRFFAHDILKSWGKIKKYGPYDIVIVDPPSFQKGSFIAKKDYIKIIKKLNEFSADDAHILLCLNAPEQSEGEFLSQVNTTLKECGNAHIQYQTSLVVSEDFKETHNGALKMAVFKKCSLAV